MPTDPTGPIDPDAILRQPFTTVRRGYDPLEVQTYLMSIAGELRGTRERERDLERQLGEASDRLAHLDEAPSPAQLTSLLGEEMTRVLDAANAAADELRAKAERDAAAIRVEANEVLERKVREAEEAATQVRTKVDGVLDQARVDAEAEIEAAREQGREMLAEAQGVRQRMLDDLVQRRRLLRKQLEQLQAGRSRLLDAYQVLRAHVDEVTTELDVALPEAKLAAEAASLSFSEETGDPELDAELAALTQLVEAEAEAEAAADSIDELSESDEDAGRLAPDPAEGRHSTSVKIIRTGEVPVVEIPDEPDEPASSDDLELVDAPPAPPAAEVPEAEPAPATAAPGATPGGDTDTGEGAGGSKAMVAGLFARIKEEATQLDGDDVPPVIAGNAESNGSHAAAEPDELDEDANDPELTAVAEFTRALSRRLKRELSAEQNEVLDAVRREKKLPKVDAVLPDPEDHVERYAAVALPALAGAAAAGAEVTGQPAKRTKKSEPGKVSVGDLAAELAAGLVAPLRDRIEQAFAKNGDADELIEALSAAYREWRSQKVDAPAAGAVQEAFDRAATQRV